MEREHVFAKVGNRLDRTGHSVVGIAFGDRLAQFVSLDKSLQFPEGCEVDIRLEFIVHGHELLDDGFDLSELRDYSDQALPGIPAVADKSSTVAFSYVDSAFCEEDVASARTGGEDRGSSEAGDFCNACGLAQLEHMQVVSKERVELLELVAMGGQVAA